MATLENPDYIALHKPNADYKLLLYLKPESIMIVEIDFIVLISNIKFYTNRTQF